jgi:hypothetical protein
MSENLKLKLIGLWIDGRLTFETFLSGMAIIVVFGLFETRDILYIILLIILGILYIAVYVSKSRESRMNHNLREGLMNTANAMEKLNLVTQSKEKKFLEGLEKLKRINLNVTNERNLLKKELERINSGVKDDEKTDALENISPHISVDDHGNSK